jgi:hypothetical protein
MSRNKISRRQVLRAAALAPAAGSLFKSTLAASGESPPLLWGRSVSASEPGGGFNAMETVLPQLPRTGSGEFAYEVVHDWLVPPDNLKWGDTHGLAEDSQGRIYVAHTVHPGSVSLDAIAVFDADGKFVESWGAEFRGGAHGLDLRKEGSDEFLYHCDTRRRLVVKTDLRGKVLWERGMPREAGVYEKPEQWCPTNVAFAPDGDFFVGDGYGSSYVHRYGRDGNYKATIGKPGKAAGEMACPHGLWVDDRDGDPKLCVCDRSNNRLQYFTLDGKHLSFVTEGMRAPCHLKYRNGFALVPDLSSVVTILDRSNKPIAHLGDGHPTNLRGAVREGFVPGKFVHPHTAIWIGKMDILVAEWVPIGRITRLRRLD